MNTDNLECRPVSSETAFVSAGERLLCLMVHPGFRSNYIKIAQTCIAVKKNPIQFETIRNSLEQFGNDYKVWNSLE